MRKMKLQESTLGPTQFGDGDELKQGCDVGSSDPEVHISLLMLIPNATLHWESKITDFVSANCPVY